MKSIVLFVLVVALHPAFANYCYSQEYDMVEVSVEVTEINNKKAEKLGIKWFDTIKTGEVSWDSSNRTPASLPEVPSIIKVGDWARYTALTADLRLLIEKGAAQILSKPKLVTKSGSKANFLVGGEIPVTSGGVSGGTIEWKEYGIKTAISPKILSDETIDVTLTTEVSRLDWTNQVQGLPAISTREATSSVRIKSGQTITIAGMIETNKDKQSVGIPLLCDIPVLGHLFSRRITVETKTNVLIFVTPKILKE